MVLLIALCAPIATAQKGKKTEVKSVVIPVYDTIRVHVTVTDTIRVEPKPAPRIDTLTIAHTPAQIDSIMEVWTAMQWAQSDKRFFETYKAEKDDELQPLDSLYKQRLLDLVSPMHLPYNSIVRDFINQFVGGRWSPMNTLIPLSKYYFPFIEEELLAAGLPLEMRYLPIIESNLSIRAVSRAGAAGLWQIMPSTGKGLGLEINSLVDERFDLLKSTRAACKLLKQLHKAYGSWTLAIAAYNCGPGSVNRALSEAGSKCRTYWDIYDYLPIETRGYVPKFIAAAYAYTYHKEHGINPKETPECIVTDTVMVNRIMHLGQVASTLNIPIETLRELNPQYKLDIIPATKKSYTLRLPARYVSEYVTNKEKIFAKDSLYLKEYINPANIEKKRAEQGVGYIYIVKEGDNLSTIAVRHKTTVKEIMKWNKLTEADFLSLGQKLRINRPKPRD